MACVVNLAVAIHRLYESQPYRIIGPILMAVGSAGLCVLKYLKIKELK